MQKTHTPPTMNFSKIIKSLLMQILFPKPKKDPLREFPEKLNKESRTIVVAENKELVLDANNGEQELSVTIEEDQTCNVRIQHTFQPTDFQKFVIHATVKRGAHFELFASVNEGARIDTECIVSLEGEGASSQVRGIFHGVTEAHHGFFIIMRHAAQHTEGDISLRGVYENTSRAIFSGLIKVEKDAQKTNSYFRDDVLLLDSAIAESLPTLEIEANDVKASHGSTTSRINEEQLFYLQSRGLTAQQARNMIVSGFLSEEIS
jgi:Fe-S cluster assembly scaffold protein SufB